MSQSKKRLLYSTVAVLAPLLSAPVPVHAVELYGIIDSYMGSTKASGEERASIGLQSGGLSTSFWGMTGTEDLGKGLNATFRIEGFFLGDTGQSGRFANDPMFSRNAYVGLSGRFGEVRLGKLSNPTFLLTGQFDPFGSSTKLSPLTTVLWNPQYGRYIAGDSGWSNAMGYYTPDFGGLSGRFVYALGEASDSNASNNAVAMLYLDKGPLTASVAFQRTRTGPAITKASWAQSVLAAGVAYDIGAAKLFLQYDGTRTSGVSLRTDTVQLGATIPMLSGRFMLSVVQTSIRAANQPDVRRRDAGIGYLYAFSKRTDAYATSLYDKLSDRGSGFTTAIGLRHKF